MNTNNLTIYRIKPETPEWFRFRTTGLTPEDAQNLNCNQFAGGIGASECGTILGLQKKYRPCTQELYHIKSGGLNYESNPNRAMLRGKILEPVIAEIWELYDGETESWVYSLMDYYRGDRNTRKMLSFRNCRNVNGYFVNNQYPYLFSSLDYYAEKNTPSLLNGRKFAEGFPIECKSISTNYAKIWIEGVPPTHIVQINQEMICTNSDYGEIACLFPDEFRFEIYPFNRDKELCDRIIHYGEKFWEKVLKAREIHAEMEKCYIDGKASKAEELRSHIDSLEPEPNDSEAYLEYIKERYQEIVPSVSGSMELYYDVMKYKLAGEIMKSLDSVQTEVQNKAMKLLTDSGAVEVSYDSLGKITYRADKNGKRSLKIAGVTASMDIKGRAEKEFNKLDLNLKIQ